MIADQLHITCIQTPLHWEDAQANRLMFEQLFNTIPAESDIVVLPEMFTTGFSMQPEKLAETMDGETVQWMKEWSAKLQVLLVGSIIVKDQNAYVNRMIWVFPNGEMEVYDKKHLFRFAGEHQHYQSGSEHKIIQCKGWRIAGFICYDLRFPVWTRNHPNKYDVAIFIANWPEKRSLHWKSLLLARAIENQAFVVGVNRVGEDGNGHLYSGDSIIIDPQGKQISTILAHQTCVETITLNYADYKNYRSSFPAFMDADSFILKD